MQIRQEPDLDCESIKNALRTINSRLNYLQKLIPPEIPVDKDPKIPKLNLKKIGIIQDENKQIQKKALANFGTNHQKLTEQQNKVSFKMRSQSFNHYNGSILLEQNFKNFNPQNLQNTFVQINKTQIIDEFDIQKKSLEILDKSQINKENLQLQYNQQVQPIKFTQPEQKIIFQQSNIKTTPLKIICKKSQPNIQINEIQYQNSFLNQQLQIQQPCQQYVKVIQNYESSNCPILQYRYSQHHNSRSSSFHNLENCFKNEKKI
ncbi:unnamed protein product [Paramecium sonneborni]|uniref:Uncharacterized protein n=1 Tax=Paramecium sonneborni TaxID=65129 RepID=A0A8S1KGY6_9CILI|nr:unnamed protein product [Paramecium sonneborni]